MDAVVVIRWNLRIAGTRAQQISDLRARPDWHRKRLDLWQRYTMPSLLRQTHEQFQVWLCCDPAEKEQNAELEATFSPDARFQIVTDWKKQIESLFTHGSASDPMIMCRMDSDDMINSQLLDIFCGGWRRARSGGKMFLQPARGYALETSTGNVYRWVNPSPAIYALPMWRCEAESLAGPAIYHHGMVRGRALVLDDDPLFCVTLHDTNICNSRTNPWVKEQIQGQELTDVRAEYQLA